MLYKIKLKIFKILQNMLKFFNLKIYYSKDENFLSNLKVSKIIDVGVAKGTNFLTSGLVVNFLQSTRSIDVDVTVTPSSETAATVAVPSSVYNNVQGGDAVTIKVTNSDGVASGTQNTTVVAYATGGTITTSGGKRYHKCARHTYLYNPIFSQI